ncbi:hypothetical protein EJK51_0023 [Moraxella catarrhalis]|nr:hypothetical protein EJK52_0024 [Moraxella catarrhalis]AZQ90752.1 hypothetical protein EJK51_0023 [Moraxella catarrhalis]
MGKILHDRTGRLEKTKSAMLVYYHLHDRTGRLEIIVFMMQ